jgi:hypothetical protein
MVPQHIVRYVVVAAAIYATAVYGMALRPDQAFTLSAVAIGALYIADHYAHYSWLQNQLYGNFYPHVNDTFNDPMMNSQQYPPPAQFENYYNPAQAEMYTTPQQTAKQKNVSQLYQFRDAM